MHIGRILASQVFRGMLDSLQPRVQRLGAGHWRTVTYSRSMHTRLASTSEHVKLIFQRVHRYERVERDNLCILLQRVSIATSQQYAYCAYLLQYQYELVFCIIKLYSSIMHTLLVCEQYGYSRTNFIVRQRNYCLIYRSVLSTIIAFQLILLEQHAKPKYKH